MGLRAIILEVMGDAFLSLVKQKHTEYKKWQSVYCPSIGEQVHFTKQGFRHFRFKSDNTPRNIGEVRRRLHLLPLVKPIIEQATAVEYKPKGNTDYWLIEATTHEKEKTIRIVLRRRVKTGRVQFLSAYELRKQKLPSKDESF